MIQAIEKLCETFKHKPEDIYLWIGILRRMKNAHPMPADGRARWRSCWVW